MTVAIGASAYKAWNPTQRQEQEPDTRYLQDMGVEATLDPWDGGMMAADEVTGGAPPWRGGTAAVVVAGKYRDGLRASGTSVIAPSTGVWPADQWTYEFFVSSTLAWASLSTAYAIQFWCDYNQLITVMLSASVVRARYVHAQDVAGVVDKTAVATGQSFAADTFVSIAVTLLAGTMRLYVNGVQVATQTGCTSPRMWGDNANAPYGGLTLGIDTHLTISDFRLSGLARVPGQAPA